MEKGLDPLGTGAEERTLADRLALEWGMKNNYDVDDPKTLQMIKDIMLYGARMTLRYGELE